MFLSGSPEWLREYLFFELAGEFDITEVHEILFGDMGIEVLFVGVEGVERMVVELAFVFVVVHICYIYLY